jgi:hypothetical protein
VVGDRPAATELSPLPPEASGLLPRCLRMRRVLANVSEAELRLWLKVGERALADRDLSAARRTIAIDQVAACRALLEGRGDCSDAPADWRGGGTPADDIGGNWA